MKKIVVVGGGTSGWLSASYLAAKLTGVNDFSLQFTLIESSDIPTIGVGEATTPSIRATLADIGFNEFDFMRLSNATFKHGILFKQWTNSPEHNPNDEYFHPFERPLRAGTDGLDTYWIRGLDPKGRSFQDAVSIQHQIAKISLSPKTQQDKPYNAPLPYAYHLDAGKLAEALKKAGKQRGVKHIVATIASVRQDKNGDISSVVLKNGQTVEGDLFIDCTGFLSLLIEKTMKADFVDKSDILFCDSAVTVQVKNKDLYDAKPYTTSTAMKNGWIWDIGLNDRRGTGYVWSSKHTSAEDAENTLIHYNNLQDSDVTLRHLKFKVGYRCEQWKQNCVAVGLSSGFIEPLESTGIHLVEQACWSLASLIPRYFNKVNPQKIFNRFMLNHYEMAMNFVKYHYLLSKREDSTFWRDNIDQNSWSPWLIEQHDMWQGGAPEIYDLEQLHSIFDHGSYQYVYFGMHQKPAISPIGGKRDAFAQKMFSQVSDGVKNAKRRLVPHAQILKHIHEGVLNERDLLRDTESNIRVNSSIRNTPSNFKATI